MLNNPLRRAGRLRRKSTMIELVVVLFIVSLLTALAVSTLREESPASLLNRQCLALDAWCAAVRYSCAEEGRDYSVRFIPEKNFFYACPVEENDDKEPAEVPESGPMRLEFPEKIALSTAEQAEEEARETEFVELFRFFPSGGAACVNRPVLRIEKLVKVFEISFLTGQLLTGDGEDDDDLLRQTAE